MFVEWRQRRTELAGEVGEELYTLRREDELRGTGVGDLIMKDQFGSHCSAVDDLHHELIAHSRCAAVMELKALTLLSI